MESKPDGSGPPLHAYSPMSKLAFGRYVPKNVAGSWMLTSILMPIACSCCWKIWLLSTRDALVVVAKRNSALWPPQVQILPLLLLGDEGPPVHPFFLSSLIAALGL